jgi:hypothetical protein
MPLPLHYLTFRPPLVGFEDEFNTIRLGKKWATRLDLGQYVLLVDARDEIAFGLAVVQYLEVGKLAFICDHYGDRNHTQIGFEVAQCGIAGARVLEVIRKMYGPHIALPTKTATVIGLRRIPA